MEELTTGVRERRETEVIVARIMSILAADQRW